MAANGICARLLSHFNEIVNEGGYLGCIAVLGTFATWMIAIIDCTVELAGPFAPILRHTFGVRMAFMVSGVTICASLICSAFASSLSTMAVILGVLFGPTLGVANILSRDLIGRCFDKHHAVAFGIAGLGGSLAFVIFASLTQFLLDLYGWRATVMLVGAIFFNLTVCGALMKSEDGGYQAVDNKEQSVVDDQENGASGNSRSSNRTLICKLIAVNLHLDLFTSVRYWLITFASVLTWVSIFAWLIYFVPHVTLSKGYSPIEAANFVLIFGVGKLLGTLLVGQTVSACGKIGLGANVWLLISIVVVSTYFFVDPWLASSWAISVGVFIYGCFHSFTYTLFDVITKEAVGVDRLGSALGWIGLKSGVVRLAVLFFPGLVFDTLGSYTVAFIIMGGVNMLSFLALLALMWLQRHR